MRAGLASSSATTAAIDERVRERRSNARATGSPPSRRRARASASESASRATSRSIGRARRAGGTRASPSPKRAAMPRRGWSAPATSGRARRCSHWLLQARGEGADPVRVRLQLRAADRRARRISARRAGRAENRARILGLCRRHVRRRGSRRGELPRDRPPPAFLFRHRRRREGRLRAFPPMRRAAERAGRAQDRQRL